MSDETPETETPTSPPVTAPTLDLDATIRVGGQDISVGDLIKAREDLDYLKQDYSKLVSFRDATTKVLRPDVDPAVKEQAARQLLGDMGYREAEIEQYVGEWMANQTEDSTVAHQEKQPDRGGTTPEDQTAEALAETIMATQRQAQQAHDDMQRMRAEHLNGKLNAQVMMGLEMNQNARTMLNKLEEINGKDALLSARAAIERDIRQQTLENLRSRRTAAGVFEEAWISEESGKATEQVLLKYRSVIGDPNRLGRAPETDSSANEFMNRKPLSAPAWKPGTSNGDIESALDAYNKDALSRLASGLDTGSDGRV